MQTEQRIKELRQMFIELSTITVNEIKEGKQLSELKDIQSMMKRITAELEKLENLNEHE